MSRRVRTENEGPSRHRKIYPFGCMSHFRYGHAIHCYERADASDALELIAAWQRAGDAWADYAARWWEHDHGRGPEPDDWPETMAVQNAAWRLEKEKTSGMG